MAANKKAQQEVILAALRAANTRRAAAAAAGVSPDTFYRWLNEDRTFSDAIEKAEGEAEMSCLEVIKQAAHGGLWTAAAWILERHPKWKADWKKTDELGVRELTVDRLQSIASGSDSGVETAGSAASNGQHD